ncbi:MAG: hypothetical protein ACRDTR_15035 [Rubrobacter sp.]
MRPTVSAEARSGWRWMAVLLATVAAFVAVLAASAPADAHDHRIPQTVLTKGAKELQVGRRVIESSWVYPSGENECAQQTAFYSFRYPEVDRVAAGSELRVRVFKAQRPGSFEIGAYSRVDKDGAPSGEGRLLKRSLERVVRDGKTVAWDAVFSAKRPDRDYYLIGTGRWQDREGCGGVEQYAYWGFHVKTGSAPR